MSKPPVQRASSAKVAAKKVAVAHAGKKPSPAAKAVAKDFPSLREQMVMEANEHRPNVLDRYRIRR